MAMSKVIILLYLRDNFKLNLKGTYASENF